VRKIFAIVCTLLLAISIAGCGSEGDKVSYGSLEFVPPPNWVDQTTESQGHYYDDSQGYFTANLMIHEVNEENFLYADEGMEEYRGYMNYLQNDEPTYRGDLEESPARVDGHDGVAITYSLDYSKSKHENEQGWGIAYFTEIIVPFDETVYYFILEEANRGAKKEVFDEFMKSVEIDR
jgi:predicted small lipoprotein YifL